jgi:hypothetical protein
VLEVYIKKILFVAPPFTLAQSLGPTPSPWLKSYTKWQAIPSQNGKELSVGIVGYA